MTSIDDLAVPIELFHTLVRLGRYQTAIDLMTDRIFGALGTLGAFRQLGELAESVTSDPRWLKSVEDEIESASIGTMSALLMGLGYFFAGDPGRAVQAYDAALTAIVSLDKGDQMWNAFIKSLRALALCQLGQLAQAERDARQGMAINIDDQLDPFGFLALGSVLVRRGLIEDGRAWLTDYRAVEDGDAVVLRELGWLALKERDHPAAEELLDLMDADVGATRDVLNKVDSTILRGALAAWRGDDDQTGEVLSEALAITRSVGMAEDEVIARIELARWHLRGQRVEEAREHIRDAIELAERLLLRLRLADALNVFSQIEHVSGDTTAAIDAARAAFRQTWCDGPPFSYASALTDARANLAALGEPEPTGLPSYQPEAPPVPVAVRPMPPVSESAASWRAYGWPTGQRRQADVLAEIHRVGWICADNTLIAELSARVARPDGAEIRAGLLAAEAFEPAIRVELAAWMFRGGHPEAEPVLRELLHCPDIKVRTRAVVELFHTLDQADRRLLTADLDGQRPFLDPTEPITEERIAEAAQKTGESVDQVRSRYERLAEPFRLQLPAGHSP